jgi:hypothetical protein
MLSFYNPEDCSVCFSSNYIQNDRFICQHPLCIECYIKLDAKRCPVCRSSDRFDIYDIQVQNRIICVESRHLNGFVVHSTYYRKHMNRFLKARLNPDIVLRVNHLLRQDKFILIKGFHYNVGMLSDHELIDLVLNKRFNQMNTTILKSLLKLRMF